MTTKPPMPKRPAKKAAKVQPVPTKMSGKQKDELELDADLLNMDQLACVLMAVEWDRETAAARLGWSLDRVQESLNEPASRLVLRRMQERLLDKLVTSKANSIIKTGVTRAAMEERLMQLAMMDPKETKGTIVGQVEALKTLADKFGYAKKDDPLENKTPEELQEIVRNSHRRIIEGAVQ